MFKSPNRDSYVSNFKWVMSGPASKHVIWQQTIPEEGIMNPKNHKKLSLPVQFHINQEANDDSEFRVQFYESDSEIWHANPIKSGIKTLKFKVMLTDVDRKSL